MVALIDDLKGYWSCDEPGGGLLNSHNAYDFTLGLGAASAAGKLGRSRSWDGTSQYGYRADNADLRGGDRDWTIQAWVYLTSTGSTRLIWCKGAYDVSLDYDHTTSRFRLRITDTSSNPVQVLANNLGAPAVNTWYLLHAGHIAATNTIWIGVNGQPANTNTYATDPPRDTTNDVAVAAYYDGSKEWWEGRLDEIAFWARAVTDAERLLLYNGDAGLAYHAWPASPPLLAGLVGYYKLDEASGAALDAHSGLDFGPSNNAPGTTTGVIGTARSFNSTLSNRFFRSTHSDFEILDRDWTIQAWARMNDITNIGTIWGAGLTLKLWYNNGGDGGPARFELVNFTNSFAINIAVSALNFGTPSQNTWYLVHAGHVAARNELWICVNAGTPDTATYYGELVTTTNPSGEVSIGAYSSIYWSGALDEIAFWNREITAAERTQLYNGGAGLEYPLTVSTPATSGFRSRVGGGLVMAV